MIAGAPPMFLEHPFDAVGVEKAGSGETGRLPRISGKIIEAANEPVRQGHLET